jgi:hypothetical protein
MKTFSSFIKFLFLVLFSNCIHAQGTYMNIGGGYGIATASMTIGAEVNPGSTKQVKGTFGEGPAIMFAFGKKMNQNAGIGLDISYLLGNEKSVSYTYAYSYGDFYSGKYKVTMLRIAPALQISTAGKNKLYAKTGVVAGILGKLELKESALGSGYSGNVGITDVTTEYTGGIAIGFSGGVGGEFRLSDNLFLFTEISFIAQAWAPSESEITQYTVDGTDQLPFMTISQKKAEYESELSSSSISNSNEPKKRLKQYLPMSSIALNAGLHFKFSKKPAAVSPLH